MTTRPPDQGRPSPDAASDAGNGLRVGIYAPISHPFGLAAPEDVLGFLAAVDRRGFDSVWVGDHLLWNGNLLEATTVLAAAAALTRRIDIGSNVYLPALRPPLVSARSLGTIDYLSGGRLVVGAGLGGENPAEFAAVGLDVHRRRSLFDAALDEMLHIWSKHETAAGDPVSPVPATIRLWIGGRTEPALRRAVARGAEAWSAHLMSPERVASARAVLHSYAEEAACPAPDVAVTVFVDIKGSRDDEGRRFMEAHFGDSSEALLKYVVVGDVSECRDKIAAFAPTADHILLFPATARPWEKLDDLSALAAGLRDAGRAAG